MPRVLGDRTLEDLAEVAVAVPADRSPAEARAQLLAEGASWLVVTGPDGRSVLPYRALEASAGRASAYQRLRRSRRPVSAVAPPAAPVFPAASSVGEVAAALVERRR